MESLCGLCGTCQRRKLAPVACSEEFGDLVPGAVIEFVADRGVLAH